MMGLYDSVDLLAKDKNGNIVHWAPSGECDNINFNNNNISVLGI